MVDEMQLPTHHDLEIQLKDANSTDNIVLLHGPPLSGKTYAINKVWNKDDDQQVYVIDHLSQFNDISWSGSRIYIKLPIFFATKNELLEWSGKIKNFLDKFKGKALLEGRSYVIRCLLQNVDAIKIDPSIDDDKLVTKRTTKLVTKRTTEYLTNFFKTRGNPDQRLAGIRSLRYSFYEKSAKKLVEQSNEYDPKITEHILNYSKVDLNGFKGTYSPPLIIEGIEKIRDGENVLNDIKRSEKVFYPKSPLTTSASAAGKEVLQDKLASSVNENINNIAASVSILYTGLLSAGLGAAGMFIVPFIIGLVKKGDNPQAVLINTYKAWQNLTKYKKEIVSYYYDEELLLIPGNTQEILDNLFGKSEKDFEKVNEKLKNVTSTLDSIVEDLNKIFDKIKRVEIDLMEDRGLLVEPKQLGLIYDEGSWLISKDFIGEDKDILLVTSNTYNDSVNKIVSGIKQNKIMVVTGAKGVGKSLLARHALAQNMIENSTDVVNIETIFFQLNFDKKRSTYSQIEKEIVLFDPVVPDWYKSSFLKSGAGDLKRNTVDQQKLTQLFGEILMLNTKGVPAVLVFSLEILCQTCFFIFFKC